MGLAYPPMDNLASCSSGAGLGLPRGGRYLGDSHKGLCGLVMEALSIPPGRFLRVPASALCPQRCLPSGMSFTGYTCLFRKLSWNCEQEKSLAC